MDKLIVTGLDAADGEYECDILELVTIGSPDALTAREHHRIKVITEGIRGGELVDAIVSGDEDVMLALAVVVMERAGKTPNVDRMWDAPVGTALRWLIGADGDADVPPPVAPPLSEPNGVRSTSGGEVSLTPSASPAPGRSLIGLPASQKSATSDPQTLAS